MKEFLIWIKQVPFIWFIWGIVITCWILELTKIERADWIVWAFLIFMTLLCCMPVLGWHFEKKAWNNGGCPKCEKGFWKSFDCDSQGGTGYKCTFCGNSHWQSGWYNYHIND